MSAGTMHVTLKSGVVHVFPMREEKDVDAFGASILNALEDDDWVCFTSELGGQVLVIPASEVAEVRVAQVQTEPTSAEVTITLPDHQPSSPSKESVGCLFYTDEDGNFRLNRLFKTFEAAQSEATRLSSGGTGSVWQAERWSVWA